MHKSTNLQIHSLKNKGGQMQVYFKPSTNAAEKWNSHIVNSVTYDSKNGTVK